MLQETPKLRQIYICVAEAQVCSLQHDSCSNKF